MEHGLGSHRAEYSRKRDVITHLLMRWSIAGTKDVKLEYYGNLMKYKLAELEQILKDTPYQK